VKSEKSRFRVQSSEFIRAYHNSKPTKLIEVYDIDFSRPSPESKSGRGIPPLKLHRFGSGSMSMSRHSDKSRFYRPKVKIANPQISRGSGAQRPGYRSTRVLHATIPSGSGPARKHTAKFEPAAWSWAQMTSGSGAPKLILSAWGDIQIQTSKAKLST
jgi:hypothetical protein